MNYIKKLNLRPGDLVFYETSEKYRYQRIRGYYWYQGLKKCNWLKNFKGTVSLVKRFEDMNVPGDLTKKNKDKILKIRNSL